MPLELGADVELAVVVDVVVVAVLALICMVATSVDGLA